MRLVSSVTVRAAVMSIVLKLAREPAPSATVPPAQLPAVLQVLLALFVQMPSAAKAELAQKIKVGRNAKVFFMGLLVCVGWFLELSLGDYSSLG